MPGRVFCQFDFVADEWTEVFVEQFVAGRALCFEGTSSVGHDPSCAVRN